MILPNSDLFARLMLILGPRINNTVLLRGGVDPEDHVGDDRIVIWNKTSLS